MNPRREFHSIDEYISAFPEGVREKLKQMRRTIHECVPEAEEAIAYSMPTFRLHGDLVHFAAFQRHIGFYPTSSGIEAFKAELAGYRHSKGAVQFPLDRPLPLPLVREIVLYRAAENRSRKGRI
jgi:uncharacterized protein YdhG (YjbR/CyaY superfamily)